MDSPGVQDLRGIDRDVARAVKSLGRWRAALESGPSAIPARDPFEGLRHVASRSTRQALIDLTPSASDVPLRDALVRWVDALIGSRIGTSDDEARAQAVTDPVGIFQGESPRPVTWRGAFRGLAESRTAEEGARWLSAAAESAEPLAAANRVRAARRVEVARLLGHSHPWDTSVGVTPQTLRELATKLLDSTEDLSRAVWKEALRDSPDTPAARIRIAVGRDAGEGWPARLTPAWLEEIFGGGPRGLPIALPSLPRVLGAASFSRALASFGFAVRLAATPSSLPFALARDPTFIGAHRLAFVFGSLPTDPTFCVKSLGVGRRIALAQSRILARTALLETRLHAARLLLGDDAALAPADRFTEIGSRVFGSALDARLRGAWPEAREDEPARLAGLLLALPFRNALRDRFDEDWFRNPQAWSHLRRLGASAAQEPVPGDSLGGATASLALAFEEALG